MPQDNDGQKTQRIIHISRTLLLRQFPNQPVATTRQKKPESSSRPHVIIELRQILCDIIGQPTGNHYPFPPVVGIEQEKLELLLIGNMGRIYASPKEKHRYAKSIDNPIFQVFFRNKNIYYLQFIIYNLVLSVCLVI